MSSWINLFGCCCCFIIVVVVVFVVVVRDVLRGFLYRLFCCILLTFRHVYLCQENKYKYDGMNYYV